MIIVLLFCVVFLESSFRRVRGSFPLPAEAVEHRQGTSTLNPKPSEFLNCGVRRLHRGRHGRGVQEFLGECLGFVRVLDLKVWASSREASMCHGRVP